MVDETEARVDWPVATREAACRYPEAVMFVAETAVDETEAPDI